MQSGCFRICLAVVLLIKLRWVVALNLYNPLFMYSKPSYPTFSRGLRGGPGVPGVPRGAEVLRGPNVPGGSGNPDMFKWHHILLGDLLSGNITTSTFPAYDHTEPTDSGETGTGTGTSEDLTRCAEVAQCQKFKWTTPKTTTCTPSTTDEYYG